MPSKVKQAVILAGGLGERLRPLTKIIPKPLLPIGERSVLEIIITNLAKAGIKEIYLAINYKFEMFQAYLGNGKRYGVRIRYSLEKQPLSTAGPLKLLKKELKHSILVTNADVLTNMDYRAICDYHEKTKADLVLATKEFRTPLSYGVVTTNGPVVTSLEEKPVIVSRINAGIYVIRTNLLRYIPKNRPYSMNIFIRDVLARGCRVCHYELTDYWLDIGQMADYERAQSMVSNGTLVI